MTTYLVSWQMEIEAGSPREAAMKALRIQRDPESIATEFRVDGEPVDLGETPFAGEER